jgi:hypothetical protein
VDPDLINALIAEARELADAAETMVRCREERSGHGTAGWRTPFAIEKTRAAIKALENPAS